MLLVVDLKKIGDFNERGASSALSSSLCRDWLVECVTSPAKPRPDPPQMKVNLVVTAFSSVCLFPFFFY